MVNASLNWASIVGIVLAVGGAMLYFMRSFKPALARDYDVFFAAIGLLCGGILFFQGWRLDPILQFGQFLLAATTVFFAYESVRLRGVSTEQARRSAYFDDEPAPARGPAGGLRGGDYDDSYDRFDEPLPLRRRFRGAEVDEEEEAPERDFYRPRRPSSRAAIPEQAASRRRGREDSPSGWGDDSERDRRMARFGNRDEEERRSRTSFGERRNLRQEQRRGSRPTAAEPRGRSVGAPETPSSTSMRRGAPEDAAFAPSRAQSQRPSATSSSSSSTNIPSPTNPSAGTPMTGRRPGPGSGTDNAPASRPASRPPAGDRPAPRSSRPRDNSSRFDD